MTPFEIWWSGEDFLIEPDEDLEEFTERIARAAWEKGAEGKDSATKMLQFIQRRITAGDIKASGFYQSGTRLVSFATMIEEAIAKARQD